MIALLAAAVAAGVAYVSWKNNHELSLALSGSSDLDVFVPLADRPAFLELARQQRWAAAENPVARFPWVTHLYHPGGHHLHVYFRVVTGESWLKEYVLPLDDYLIANRVRSPEHGVWVLAPAAQAHLFVVRHLLTGGSPASRP